MRQEGRPLKKKIQVKRHLPFSNILQLGENLGGLGLDPEEHVWGLYEDGPHPVFWNLVIVCMHAQLCLILCNPMECHPPGSSVHGIFQVKILERDAYSSGKDYPCNAGDAGVMDSVPALGRSSGGGNGNPLQYFCLENLMDRWRSFVGYSPGGQKETWPKQLSTHAGIYMYSPFSCTVCMQMLKYNAVHLKLIWYYKPVLPQ